MGKRKLYSRQELLKKIKKLEKLVQPSSESSSDSDSENEARAPTDNEELTEVIMILDEESPTNTNQEQEGGDTVSDKSHQDLTGVKPDPETISESVINILGDDGIRKDVTQNCLPELAVRWENILKSGLKKETLNNLESKYKLLGNCPSLNPPRINIEIKSAAGEGAIKRDTKISEDQKQLALIITSLGLAMTDVIKNSPHNIKTVEYLSDSARLLCNMHYEVSKKRKNLLAAGLNKDVKDLTDDCPIEDLLFGNDFAEKIKANQAAKKLSSQSLKPAVPSKVIKDKPRQNLNYRGPLKYQPPARPSGQKSSFKPQSKNSTYQPQPRPSNRKPPPQRRH